MFNTEGVQQTLYIPHSLPQHRYDLNTPETEATKLFHHARQRWMGREPPELPSATVATSAAEPLVYYIERHGHGQNATCEGGSGQRGNSSETHQQSWGWFRSFPEHSGV